MLSLISNKWLNIKSVYYRMLKSLYKVIFFIGPHVNGKTKNQFIFKFKSS